MYFWQIRMNLNLNKKFSLQDDLKWRQTRNHMFF